MISAKKVTRIDWRGTLRSMKIGESRKFRRKEITVSNLRTVASKLKSREGLIFTIKSEEKDDLAIITREK